nr:unnamed protein product [Digitaria exilis]
MMPCTSNPWKHPRVRNLSAGCWHLRATSASITGVSSVKSSSAGRAANKGISPATVMAASSPWLVDASCVRVSLRHLAATVRSASSPTKSICREELPETGAGYRRCPPPPKLVGGAKSIRGDRQAEVDLGKRGGVGRVHGERRGDVLRPAVELGEIEPAP